MDTRVKGLQMLAGACTAAIVLTGCSKPLKTDHTDEVQRAETKQQRLYQETEVSSTEPVTELYEVETETDFFGEVMMRSIWEVMPDDVRLWAAEFDVSRVDKVLYTTFMEGESQVYEITSAEQIQSVFNAIDQMTAAGTVASPGNQGDIFEFIMKDGIHIKFSFSLTCIVMDGTVYETGNSEQLWELTGNIIFGKETEADQ